MEVILGAELYVRVAICALAVWALIAAARAAFKISLNSEIARRVFPTVALLLGAGLMMIPAAMPEGQGGWYERIVLGIIAGALATHGRTTIRRLFGKGLPDAADGSK